jgi:hypothetical protein
MVIICFWNQQDNKCGYSTGREKGWATARSGSPAGPTGCETLILVFKAQHEKLLDDTEVLLYCDHQFNRQFVLSLS